jgi:hypothetical protein
VPEDVEAPFRLVGFDRHGAFSSNGAFATIAGIRVLGTLGLLVGDRVQGRV